MRYTANGKAVTTFSLACNRTHNTPEGERREETDWFDVVTWDKLAELCSQFLRRGGRPTSKDGCRPGRGRARTARSDTRRRSSRRRCCSWGVPVAGGAARMDRLDDGGAGPAAVDPDDLPFE